MNEETIIDASSFSKRRRELLPIWMKVFIWIFLVLGAFIPVGIVLAFFKIDFLVSLYGLDTNNPLSLIGLLLMALFILKFFTAYALWNEKNWAIKIGKIDAIVGIIACSAIMFILPFIPQNGNINISFRLELLALIPYLVRLSKIQSKWENNENTILI